METFFEIIITNYGAVGAIALVIGGLAFFIIKELRKSNKALIDKQIEMNKDMTSTIVESLSSLSKTLTDDIREQNKEMFRLIINKEKHDAKQHNDNLISRRNVTGEINGILNDLRLSLNAKRVSIFEFHNSFANQTGFPFLKFTMTYEKFSKGCIPLQQSYQGIQFSAVCDVCEDVLNSKNHLCVIDNVDEIEEKVPMLLHDIQPEVGAVVFKGLFNAEDNMLIGLICIEFKENISSTFDEESVITAARIIAELITLSKPTSNECETY